MKIKYFLLLILIQVHPLFSNTVQRKTLLYMNFAEDNQLLPIEKNLLEQTLIIELGKQEITQIVFNNPTGDKEIDKDNFCLFSGADSWMEISITGKRESISISWIFKDIQDSVILRESQMEQHLDSNYLGLYGSFWNPLLDEIENYFKPVETTGQITLEGLPGSTVIGLNEQELEINETGQITIELSAPALYSFSIKKEGYYPEQFRMYLQNDEVKTFGTEQKKERFISFYGGLYMAAFPSLALSYQIPHTGFQTTAGVDLFLLGLTPSAYQNNNDAPQFINNYNLFYPYLSTGYIIETNKGFFRYPLAVGFLLRLTPGEETTDFIDSLSPWGIFLSLSLEYRLKRNLLINLEFRPTLFYTDYPEIFQEAYNNDFIAVNQNFQLFLPTFLVGIRWLP